MILTLAIITVAALYYPFTPMGHRPIIRSDGHGYYAYLRAYLVHRVTEFETIPWPGRTPENVGFWRNPKTGRLANQYPIGTALAELPFFLAVHVAAALLAFPMDGLSAPYQWGVAASGLCWFLIGLVATWRFLAKRFGPATAALASAAIAVCTNLLHYAIAEPSMSHVYAFAVFALLLWQADRFWGEPSHARAAWLGILTGLLLSVRTFDVLLVPLALYPALYRVNRSTVRRYAASFLGWSFVALLPYLITTTYYVGRPWASTYPVQFNWLHPMMILVLFSVRKGWFFWTPIAAIGVVGLLIGLRFRTTRHFCALALGSIAVIVYVIASWAAPEMGQSFGHRGFVDCLPLIAFGLALLPHTFVKGLVVVLVTLNLFLTYSYWHGRILGDLMTWKAYERVFSAPLTHALGLRPPRDSSQRSGLSAEIKLLELRREGDVLTTTISVRNTGSALWLDSGIGMAQVAVRPWEHADCRGREVLDRRTPLGREVGPSQSTTVRAEVPLAHVPRPFAYLCIEMVAEGVTWFRDVGGAPLAVRVDDSLLSGHAMPESRKP
jgi:hypothetical protein